MLRQAFPFATTYNLDRAKELNHATSRIAAAADDVIVASDGRIRRIAGFLPRASRAHQG
jgi:hypothetical protein